MSKIVYSGKAKSKLVNGDSENIESIKKYLEEQKISRVVQQKLDQVLDMETKGTDAEVTNIKRYVDNLKVSTELQEKINRALEKAQEEKTAFWIDQAWAWVVERSDSWAIIRWVKQIPLLNAVIRVLFILLVFSIIYAYFASPTISGDTNFFRWLFTSDIPDQPTSLENLQVLFAPLIALALCIERIVETIFTYFEGNVDDVAKLTDLPAERLAEMRAQLNEAWEVVAAGEELKEAEPAAAESANKRIASAEETISRISFYLTQLPKDIRYVAYKGRASLVISFLLGFIIAVWTDKGVFDYLGIGVPRIIDIMVTGPLLGAGAKPIHSLIGLLDGLKDGIKNFSLSRPNLSRSAPER